MFAFLRSIVIDGLVFFYGLLGDYGLAIIMLTITVRAIMLPLSLKQTKATRAMQAIGPEKKRLEEKYKDNKDKLNKELLELYRKHKVNPLAGCLPLLIQLPVLIIIFRVLQDPDTMEAALAAKELLPENPADYSLFLGMLDLNSPDRLFGILPGVIPLLAGATTFLQTKLTMVEQPQGAMGGMATFMPFMIVIISYGLAAGLPLYWLTGNIFAIVQHFAVNKLLNPAPVSEGGGNQ